MKKFNITGTCFPNRHYMVDLTSRVAQIKSMVDDGAYFCINRGRQFGKTTTLHIEAVAKHKARRISLKKRNSRASEAYAGHQPA